VALDAESFFLCLRSLLLKPKVMVDEPEDLIFFCVSCEMDLASRRSTVASLLWWRSRCNRRGVIHGRAATVPHCALIESVTVILKALMLHNCDGYDSCVRTKGK